MSLIVHDTLCNMQCNRIEPYCNISSNECKLISDWWIEMVLSWANTNVDSKTVLLENARQNHEQIRRLVLHLISLLSTRKSFLKNVLFPIEMNKH